RRRGGRGRDLLQSAQHPPLAREQERGAHPAHDTEQRRDRVSPRAHRRRREPVGLLSAEPRVLPHRYIAAQVPTRERVLERRAPARAGTVEAPSLRRGGRPGGPAVSRSGCRPPPPPSPRAAPPPPPS